MKKLLFNLLIILSVAPFYVSAQFAYQDAKKLKELRLDLGNDYVSFSLIEESHKKASEILKNYTKKNTYGEIFAEYSDNPFLRLPEISALSSAPVASSKSILGGLGGLNVTTVADGIARFLVERTKAELDIYFFEQFRDFLENNAYSKDVEKLFPSTYSVMKVVGKEIYDYQKYLQALREAFAQDLSSLLVNSNGWINEHETFSTLVKQIRGSKFYPYLRVALQVAVDIQDGKHPGDIMKRLAELDYTDTTIWGEFGPILKASNIISQSLRSASADRYWINDEDFKAFEDPIFIKIYLGLIYQQFKTDGITIGRDSVTTTLKKFAGHLNDAQDAINNFSPVLAEIDQILKQLKSSSDPGSAANYVTLSNGFIKIMAVAKSGLIPTDKPLLNADTEFLLAHSFNLVADVRTKSYSAAVIELSVILQRLNTDKDFVDGIIKYGSFMANVATARTAEEVKEAIEVVALPPGSYRVKRESHLNVSLNGYVGFYGGNEYMASSENRNAFSAGLFAPVGFAVSRGQIGKSEKKGGKSFTFFASVIDLGALASFRFNDDQTQVASDIHFKDIFAPGGFIIWGFGKAPICIGAGVQMGPSLRSVDATGNADINKDYYVRTSGFIVVDIPFFNLYNRKDKK